MYYDGAYEYGLYHGAGEFAEEDGSLYTGTWSRGLRAGNGSQINNRERHEYSGGFLDDMYVYSLPSVSFCNILLRYHGIGKCTWVNGSVYEGAWVRGVPSGAGVYDPPPPQPCVTLKRCFVILLQWP